MSHPDPYGSTEPRGWDRSAPALPWPETDLEPGPWRRPAPGPDAYPDAEAYAGAVTDAYPVDQRHHDAPWPADGSPAAPRGRRDEPGPGDRGPWSDDRSDDDYPTAQIAPVRDEPAVRDDLAVREPAPEPPAGRRSKGRRRASAERPPTTAPPASRAGRNLPAAIGVGAALGALIVVPLFFFLPAFLAVLAAAVAIGSWEMARAVRRSGAHPPLVPLVAGGVIMVGLAWFAGPDALCLGLLVTVLGTMIWRLGDGPGNYQRDLTAATLIAVYVPFLAGFAALLAAAPDDGHLRVLVTLVAVVLSDTGGYAAGVAFGKRPMAPKISPKKSWEGFAGSVTAAAAGSALLLWLLFDVAPWWGALFGMAISCAAVLGDLGESMIKRDLGVKDMSNLLPGHGGLMDRLDSILFAVPTAYLLLAVFVPVVG
ncbi:phosphatidate cytidylyltransferase [Micromonospora sp. NPDC018662]|uniref:phosphatidate cytidylyltransferase n=1 Tax=Micromonospora sp. NPDC018662 TaxID=3364238 RepID=UPI0037B6C7B2